MRNLLICLLASCLFFACNSDEYSPNQVFNRRTATETNAKQIALLPKKPAGSPIRIAFSGDTQRSYKESELFVSLINQRNDINFVILNGDISDFGLLLEFDGIHDIYAKLRVPFISVIGNHDLVANGRAVYTRMFGPLNFTFNYAGVKFVCHDTNGREYDFDGSTPNLSWLKDNLKLDKGMTHTVAVSHVPPTDGDFDPALRQAYMDLFNQSPGLLGSLHSHQHHTLQTYYQNGTGIPFIITDAIVKRAYTLIDIKNGQITAQQVNF